MIVLATSCFGVFFLWRWRRQQESKVVFILVVCSFTGFIFCWSKDNKQFKFGSHCVRVACKFGSHCAFGWHYCAANLEETNSSNAALWQQTHESHHPSNHENPGFLTDYFRGHTMQKLCSRTLCHPVVDPLGLQNHWMTNGGMIHVSKCIRKMSFYLQIAI